MANYVQNKLINHPDKYNAIAGCIVGGAVGDALGNYVEILTLDEIRKTYGKNGIRNCIMFRQTGKPLLISDNTQMTLFTANGVLKWETCQLLDEKLERKMPRQYVADAYQDWLKTQQLSYSEYHKGSQQGRATFLTDVPGLFAIRAPGRTCHWALEDRIDTNSVDYMEAPVNDSKGCGGLTRVAPLALAFDVTDNVDEDNNIEALTLEGAQVAAITHSHPLGYLPAAMLTYLLNRIVFRRENYANMEEVVVEARDYIAHLFRHTKGINVLTEMVDYAIELVHDENHNTFIELGEGWVAEETLAIAIYCAIKHQDDFSKGIITAVNHNGDSDSTGSVTGQILGAWLGFGSIDYCWKTDLEMHDLLLEVGEDLANGCRMSPNESFYDTDWMRKYYWNHWKERVDMPRLYDVFDIISEKDAPKNTNFLSIDDLKTTSFSTDNMEVYVLIENESTPAEKLFMLARECYDNNAARIVKFTLVFDESISTEYINSTRKQAVCEKMLSLTQDEGEALAWKGIF